MLDANPISSNLDPREQGIRERLGPVFGGTESPMFHELIRAFLNSARMQRTRLRDALAAGCTREVRQAAHSLVGMSLNLSLAVLADISREIEASALRDAGVAPGVLARLDEELVAVHAVMSRLLSPAA